jgi:hypothetical protein
MRARKPVIFFDDPSLGGLDASIRGSAISDLRLNPRASRSIDYLGIHSIGELVDLAKRGIPSTQAGGRKTAAEIAGSLYALAAAITPDGFVDWVRYAEQRKWDADHLEVLLLQMRPAKGPYLRVTTPTLALLDTEARRYSLKTLHLRPRALHALEVIGISSVGDLVDAARKGITHLRAAGRQTLLELREALNALSKSVRSDGSFDAIQYAINRNFQMLPAHDCVELSNHEFPAVFLEALETAVKSRFGRLGNLVFTEYYRHASEESSFQRLRKKLGSTRQAITLRKGNIVQMLRGAVLDDDYTGCCFRFRDALVDPVRRLKAALDDPRRSALRHTDWTKSLEDILAVDWGNLELMEKPLRAILGLDVVHRVDRKFETIVLPKSRGTAAIARAQINIDRLLRSEFPSGLSKSELLEQLQRSGENDLTLQELSTLIHSISGIEYSKRTKRFRLRVEMLSRLADQLERLLDERGSPMHKRELTLEVSGFKRRKGSLRYSLHVAGAMSRDERFRAIARSGFWILAKWDTETGDIADVAARCLVEAGRALTEADLFSLIAARRPVNFNSIMSSLRDDGRFRRIGPRTWELKRADP